MTCKLTQAACLVCLLLTAQLIHACPSSMNLIPTADVVEAGVFRLQLEADGHITPFSRDASLLILTTAGLGHGLEVGADLIDVGSGTDWSGDAKWQFISETPKRPAVAVGTLDLTGRRPGTDCYLVSSWSPGAARVRWTAGIERDHLWRGLAGAQIDLDEMTQLSLDWTTGPAGLSSLGLCRTLTPSLSALLYYARSNTTSDDNFLALNFCWETPWR